MTDNNKPKNKFSLHTIIFYAVLAVLAMWIVMGSFPTGWIYDLGAGTGTAVGAKPDASVQQLIGSDILESITAWNEVPFTVTSDTFVFAPLAKLRDPDEEGIHRGNRKTGYTEVDYQMYRHLAYPVDFKTKLFYNFGMSASYNNYYLVQLADGSYIGAFFDNYKMLGNLLGGEMTLPTGYIRYADTAEKNMLRGVSEGYQINTELILDMFNYEKQSWAVDKIIRVVILLAVIAVACVVGDKIGKRRKKASVRPKECE